MLHSIKLHNVGPSKDLEIEFSERINVLTGDNGVGKSFILDIAWWSLTRTWPAEINKSSLTGLKAKPSVPRDASIQFSLSSKSKKAINTVVQYDSKDKYWKRGAGRPSNPGLILYAQVDGGFSLWDPAKNYWKDKKIKETSEIIDIPDAFVLSYNEVMNGLSIDHGQKNIVWLCNGLINDWSSWQKENGKKFELLKKVISELSPAPNESLSPGSLTRVGNDVRDIPTIMMPDGIEVPILHASAGIRRILCFAYMLVWAWTEHLYACEDDIDSQTNQIIFMIDEIESHLHPKWQRSIIKSIMKSIELLETLGASQLKTQLVIATHSPLIMSSLEELFTSTTDSWFDFEIMRDGQNSEVHAIKREFSILGDVNSWLMSEAFDLKSARSLEFEKIFEQVKHVSEPDFTSFDKAKQIEKDLEKVLSRTDKFWGVWRSLLESKGWLND